MYRIDDNVSVSQLKITRKRETKWSKVQETLKEIKVNQSFFIPIERDSIDGRRKDIASIRSVTVTFGRKSEATYISRSVIEKEAFGLRIWRIK